MRYRYTSTYRYGAYHSTVSSCKLSNSIGPLQLSQFLIRDRTATYNTETSRRTSAKAAFLCSQVAMMMVMMVTVMVVVLEMMAHIRVAEHC